MIEWVLMVVFISYTGVTSSAVPDFQTLKECTSVGDELSKNFPTFTVKYTCVQQTKK